MNGFVMMPGLYQTALRTAGITAVTLAATLAGPAASAQEPSARPVDNYSPYHPRPTEPYIYGSTSRFEGTQRTSEQPVITESTPWWQEKDGRMGIFAFMALIALGVTGGSLYLIHKHKDEIDNRP